MALVVTIVVLLILAGITINYVLGDNSVFKKATEAKLQTEIAQARERLEVVLSGAQIQKHTNSKYNENKFLDEYIIDKIKDTEIIDDVVIVDGCAFELDRSVPKIGEYIGKKDELVFPEISINGLEYAVNYKTAKFIITAKEEKNGISRIEIMQYGQVVESFTYENVKTEITKEYTVKQNGVYTVKVYSKLKGTAKVEVKELVMAIEYSPNGNEQYKKEHSSKVIVKEDSDRVKSIKYQWTDSLTEPGENTFIESCSNNSIITGKEMTGTYYLWTLLETESGKKNICRSEGFYFDNEKPIVEIAASPVSETEFTLTVNATDRQSGIVRYEFYVEGELKNVQNIVEETSSYTWNGTEMAKKECYVKVTDNAGNVARKDVEARTLMHCWATYNSIATIHYKAVRGNYVGRINYTTSTTSKPVCISSFLTSIADGDGNYGYWSKGIAQTTKYIFSTSTSNVKCYYDPLRGFLYYDSYAWDKSWVWVEAYQATREVDWIDYKKRRFY